MLTDPQEDYAKGFVPFLDCTIFLDSHPLIPRPETEFWTEKAIGEIKKLPSAHVLDLFAGSGAVGVAVLKHVPSAHVDFGEIAEAHLPVILKSIKENGIGEERSRVLQTDVYSAVEGRYDFILANPPYIARDADDVDDSVRALEPHEALYADDGGFALIEKTIAGAKAHLAEKGALYIEHRPEQAERIGKSARQNGLKAESFPDQYGVIRYSVLRISVA
jgi:release factor glutamine methyltransferase